MLIGSSSSKRIKWSRSWSYIPHITRHRVGCDKWHGDRISKTGRATPCLPPVAQPPVCPLVAWPPVCAQSRSPLSAPVACPLSRPQLPPVIGKARIGLGGPVRYIIFKRHSNFMILIDTCYDCHMLCYVPHVMCAPKVHDAWRFAPVDVIYHPPKFRNCLLFELQCWATTHFKGFVELSSLPLYSGRFGGGKVV